MTDSASSDDFFTKDHARLSRFATIADVFAWIILVVHILWVGASFIQNQYTYSSVNYGPYSDFTAMLGQDHWYAASLFVNLAGIFLRGVVLALVLKGISLGLDMIVETNLNYKEQFQGGDHEQ